MSMMHHPNVIYSTATGGPIMGTRVAHSPLDDEAARAARTYAVLNLKIALAAELERELFMVRYNRWYRRLWRYVQAMWWSILDFDYNKVYPSPRDRAP